MKTVIAIGLAASLAAASATLAQTYPAKPVRVVVPYPAGGTTDLVARIVTPVLAESLGQPVLVENKAGAGGTIGTGEVARAAPDGHTVLVVFDNHAVNHHLYKNLPYDPIRGFETVSLMVQSPLLLVGATSFPPSNVGELVALRQGEPGQGGVRLDRDRQLRTISRALLLAQRGRHTRRLHVPYKGGAPLINDPSAGRSASRSSRCRSSLPQVRGGQAEGDRARGPRTRTAAAAGADGGRHAARASRRSPGSACWCRRGRRAGGRAARVGDDEALARPDQRERLAGQGFIVVGSSPGDFRDLPPRRVRQVGQGDPRPERHARVSRPLAPCRGERRARHGWAISTFTQSAAGAGPGPSYFTSTRRPFWRSAKVPVTLLCLSLLRSRKMRVLSVIFTVCAPCPSPMVSVR